MKRFAALLILAGSVALAQSQPPSPTIPKHVSKILSRADGRSKESAFKVKSIRQEYEVLEALGLQPGTQSLVVDKRPYDVFDATDRKTGEQREVWFDISSFAPF